MRKQAFCKNMNRANSVHAPPTTTKYPLLSRMPSHSGMQPGLEMVTTVRIFKKMEAAAERRQPKKIFFLREKTTLPS